MVVKFSTARALRMSNQDGKQTPERDGELQVVERRQTQAPRRYNVVLHNDDYTTMQFVVHVLVRFFHKDETEATRIMLHVHHKGFGVAGSFTRDVAETKANQVVNYAREHGHPLKATAEPDGTAS